MDEKGAYVTEQHFRTSLSLMVLFKAAVAKAEELPFCRQQSHDYVIDVLDIVISYFNMFSQNAVDIALPVSFGLLTD